MVDLSTGRTLSTYVGYSAGQSFQNGNLRPWVEVNECKNYSINQFFDVQRKLEMFKSEQ